MVFLVLRDMVVMHVLTLHQAVIHQFAREMLAEGGKMYPRVLILIQDMVPLVLWQWVKAGPELVKQLLERTYDIPMPGVIGIYLDGEPMPRRRTSGRSTCYYRCGIQ